MSDVPKTGATSITPYGQGTEMTESIVSFIARLAQNYGLTVGELIKVFAQLVRKRYLINIAKEGGTRLYAASTMLLSCGKAAAELCRLLEENVNRTGLIWNTMLPYSQSFAFRGLIYPRRRWCPVCYYEWLRKREIIRDLLLWALQAVEICCIHGVYLHSLCPGCGRGSYQLERKLMPGFCPHCGCWLGLSIVNREQLPLISDEARWKAEQAGILVARIKKAQPGEGLRYITICREITGSIRELSRQSGVPLATLSGWFNGRLPPLDSILSLSWGVEVPFSCIDEVHGNMPPKARDGRFTHQRISGLFLAGDTVAMEWEQKILSAVADRHPPPSLAQITRELGTSVRLLRSYTPDLCKLVAGNYIRYLRAMKEERGSRLSKDLRLKFRKLAFSGEYPSRRLLEQITGRPALLREHRMKDVWNSCFGPIGLWEP